MYIYVGCVGDISNSKDTIEISREFGILNNVNEGDILDCEIERTSNIITNKRI